MNVVFCKTPSGKGVKILVNGEWLFTSVASIEEVLRSDDRWCQFGPMADKE